MKRPILLLFVLLAFYLGCKQDEPCSADCDYTYVGDLFLSDSIMDSIPYSANSQSLSFSNQFDSTITFSFSSEGRSTEISPISVFRISCPETGFGASKKEAEGNTCINYYMKEDYYVAFIGTEVKDQTFYVSARIDFPYYRFATLQPPDSIHEVLKIGIDLNKAKSFGAGIISFNHTLYSHYYSTSTFSHEVELNGKMYENVYLVNCDSTIYEIIKIYYNTSRGLLGFSLKNGENWFLVE